MAKKIFNTLILGGSSDIGIEVTEKFLKLGWSVTAQYSSKPNRLNLLKSKYKRLKILKLNFDKFNESNCNSLIKENFKNIKYDSIVNLIGYIDNIGYKNTNYNYIIKSLKINAIVPILIINYFIKQMLKNKWGRILNCSSIGVKFGGGLNTYNYSLSKHCLEFIPSSYKKWAKQNVLINNIRIGVCNTKIHKKITNKNLDKRIKLIPIGRMSEPTEIAKFVISLTTDNNTYITGQTINISGGE